MAAMQARPRVGSLRHRQAVSLEVEELAVLVRKELADGGWDHGPVSVRHRLNELGVNAPAASTLARVFARRGMVVPQPQKRPRTSWRRFQFATVHECWQLDSFQWPLIDGTICAVFQLLDDRSRFMIASRVAAGGERAEDAIAVVTAGIGRFQVPRLLLTDNGAAFNQNRLGRRTQLVSFLEPTGCRPITGKPGHPQTQGKDERVHQTLQRWLVAQPSAQTVSELQALVGRFDHHYNCHRPHQSLAMRTPLQALSEGPTAIAPLPLDASAEPPAQQVTARQNTVAATGVVSAQNALVNIGSEHAGTTVTIVNTGQNIDIFDHQGTHIRSLALIPGQTYYGNGKPRGPRPKHEMSGLT